VNKKELAEALAAKIGTTYVDANAQLTNVFDVIADALMDGHDVHMTGIGVIRPKVYEERQMWSNILKEYVTVPKKVVLRLKTSRGFSADMANNSPLA